MAPCNHFKYLLLEHQMFHQAIQEERDYAFYWSNLSLKCYLTDFYANAIEYTLENVCYTDHVINYDEIIEGVVVILIPMFCRRME